MNLNLVIEILSIIVPSLLSCVAICISIKVLKQNNKFQLESQKANIAVSLDRSRTDFIYDVGGNIRVIIKNYGNSPGVIRNISTSPSFDELSRELNKLNIEHKDRYKLNLKLFLEKDLTLAPNQMVLTNLPLNLFDNFNKKVTIEILYESLGKTFSYSETINLNYRKHLNIESPVLKNEIDSLIFIGESIREVSDKLS